MNVTMQMKVLTLKKSKKLSKKSVSLRNGVISSEQRTDEEAVYANIRQRGRTKAEPKSHHCSRIRAFWTVSKYKTRAGLTPYSSIRDYTGLTLIEFIVYISIISAIMTGGMVIGFNTLFMKTKSQSIASVSQNGRMSISVIADAVRNANSITTPAFGQTASTLMAQKQDTTSGLVGYWRFDEGSGTSASDSSGNNNTGTLQNGPAWTTGHIGTKSLSFDGTNDRVNAGSAASLDDLGPLTASAWIQPNSLGEENNGTIINKNNNGTSGAWTFFLSATGGLSFIKDYSSIDVIRTSSDNGISLGVWQHVVMTWDGSATAANIRFYKDGEEISYATTLNGSGTKNSDASLNMLMGNRERGDKTFDGLIDDVRLYNRALSPIEVQELHASQAGNYNPIVFSVSNKTLFMQEGTQSPIALTTQGVEVPSMIFRNVSRTVSVPSAIRTEFTVATKSVTNRAEFNYAQNFFTTATNRK